MSFANRVLGHLARVQALERTPPVDADVRPDFPGHYREVLGMLTQVEAGDEQARKWVESRLREYTRHRLERFVDEAHWQLLAGFAPLDARQRRKDIERALVLQLDLEDRFPAPMSAAHRHAVREIATVAWRDARAGDDLGEPGDVPRYCEAMRLVEWAPEPVLTASGRTLLGLRGTDVLRWIFALEVEQATDPDDSWRLHPTGVAEVIRASGYVFGVGDDIHPRVGWAHVARLASVGLVTLYDGEEGDVYGWDVTDLGRNVLGELGSNNNPFQLLARAFVEDANRSSIGVGTTGPAGTAAADATLRHARMVAHEIRNALLPVRVGLRAVWKALDGTPHRTQLADTRKRVDEGIERLYAFVDRSVRLADPAGARTGVFEVVAAIEEARVQLHAPSTVGLSVVIVPADAAPRCRGSRDGFVLAILNLLRNAVQVGAEQVDLRVAVLPGDGGKATLTVEDDGPGIPADQRDAILRNGVSGRANGTGHGLTVIAQVIEQELGGRLSVDASHLGGAKFTLEFELDRGTP